MELSCRCKTRPQGKNRIWFTCHPADMEYLDTVCQFLWETQDCAVYYTQDMSAPVEDMDITSHNLLVVPVTENLLTERNRAMELDIPLALQEHIPVLPLMMATNLDAQYRQCSLFRQLQYLSPRSFDQTELPFGEKLKKYLDAVLTEDALAQKVRAAFQSYIFLSYRKKDRRYAHDLMKLIHQDPRFQNIAIWYDEYLTPGESFRENIFTALEKSDLVTLLVTPNLLEEGNFVMTTEYPAAKEAGKSILPAQMEATDEAALTACYPGIPTPIDPRDINLLSAALEKIAKEEPQDPEQTYLMGLAYLDGIDVETDRQLGLEKLTQAAEKFHKDAMKKLYTMYRYGQGVAINYRTCAHWADRLYILEFGDSGQDSPEAAYWQHATAEAEFLDGSYVKAKVLATRAYSRRSDALGPLHPDTLASQHLLAQTYHYLGDDRGALDLLQLTLDARKDSLGEEHPDTLSTMHQQAIHYRRLGDFPKAQSLFRQVYKGRCAALGQEHPDTLTTLTELAATLRKKDPEYAKQILEAVYALRQKNPEHPDTLHTLQELGITCNALGDHEKALDILTQVYDKRSLLLGAEHPDTNETLAELGRTNGFRDDYRQAVEQLNRAYWQITLPLGHQHKTVRHLLWDLAHNRSLLLEQLEVIQGAEHLETIQLRHDLASTYLQLESYGEAVYHLARVYLLRRAAQGANHEDTRTALTNLKYGYEQYHDHLTRELGPDHPSTREVDATLKALWEKILDET